MHILTIGYPPTSKPIYLGKKRPLYTEAWNNPYNIQKLAHPISIWNKESERRF